MSLLKSIADIWENSPRLCALVPFDRVFTGRVPQTSLYQFPYVSVLESAATTVTRSDKTQYYRATITFHVWVDDSRLALGERVETAITAVYADQCWQYLPQWKVIDVIDGGPGRKRQMNDPTYKAWEIIKLVTLCLERLRETTQQDSACCPDRSNSSSPSSDSSTPSSSLPSGSGGSGTSGNGGTSSPSTGSSAETSSSSSSSSGGA